MIVEVKVLNRDTGEEQTLYKVDPVYGDITFSSREDAEKFIDDQMKVFSAYIEEVNNENN